MSNRGWLLMWIGIVAAAMQLLFGLRLPVFTTRVMGDVAACRMPTTLPTTQPAQGESDDTADTVSEAPEDSHP
jgi:hypothetical protein